MDREIKKQRLDSPLSQKIQINQGTRTFQWVEKHSSGWLRGCLECRYASEKSDEVQSLPLSTKVTSMRLYKAKNSAKLQITMGYLGHVWVVITNVVIVIIIKRHSRSITLIEPTMCPYSIHSEAGNGVRIQDFPQYILGAWRKPFRNMNSPLKNLRIISHCEIWLQQKCHSLLALALIPCFIPSDKGQPYCRHQMEDSL